MQVEQVIPASPEIRYRFIVTLNHIPDGSEKAEIKDSIQKALETLGVPPEQVSISVIKTPHQEGIEAPEEQEEVKIHPEGRYLLCILIPSATDGELLEPPEVIQQELVDSFVTFHRIPRENIAAVVLEDAGLQVQTVRRGGVFL